MTKKWEELTLKEKYDKITTLKSELDILLEEYNNNEISYVNTIKSVVLDQYNSDNDREENIYLNGVGMGYATKAGYFRKYGTENTTDFETNSGIYGNDCPVTYSKSSLSKYTMDSEIGDTSDAVTIKKDDNSNVTLKYNKINNNEIKEGQNCKLKYNENVFVYNVDESKYSSYEGCLKPTFTPTVGTDKSVMFHSDTNTYDECINKAHINTHNYFSLSRNQNNIINCTSYKNRSDMQLPSNDSNVYPYGTPESISEQTFTLFDNNDSSFNNAFKNTTNLFKRGYKSSSLFGSFTIKKEDVSNMVNEGDHCFLKLSRNGNLKIYKIGKTGDSLKNKSQEIFDLHLGNIKDSNNIKFAPLGSCHEEIGGYLDENSIHVEWGKRCKSAGCFIYQDKGCTN